MNTERKVPIKSLFIAVDKNGVRESEYQAFGTITTDGHFVIQDNNKTAAGVLMFPSAVSSNSHTYIGYGIYFQPWKEAEARKAVLLAIALKLKEIQDSILLLNYHIGQYVDLHIKEKQQSYGTETGK
jgi:hypothetical protein